MNGEILHFLFIGDIYNVRDHPLPPPRGGGGIAATTIVNKEGGQSHLNEEGKTRLVHPLFGGSVRGDRRKGGHIMSNIFNRKAQKLKRQYLRNNATNAERILWSKLKGKQLLGRKFRRQHGIGPFIVDFYCHECKLAIEIDGATHWTKAAKEYDFHREEHIGRYGIHFLRFTNSAIAENLDGVLIAIAEEVQGYHPLTPSSGRRGNGHEPSDNEKLE